MSLNCSEISTYEKMHYELKNIFSGDASIPRGKSHFLCTYHILAVRTIKRNQSEPIGTIPFSFSYTNFRFKSKSILARTKPFSFSFTCTYRTIFDSNENQSSIKNNSIRMKIRAIGCYVVITYITQICVVRNQRASRNQRAIST